MAKLKARRNRRLFGQVAGVLLWVVGLVVLWSQFKTCAEYHASYTLHEEMAGRIVKKYRHPDNPNSQLIALGNGDGFVFMAGLEFLWDYVKVGDSIAKDSGSLEIRLYRGDSMEVFHPSCG